MTNPDRVVSEAAAYLDVAATAIQKAHLLTSELELTHAGLKILERLRVLRNDANALAIDICVVHK